MKGGGNATLSIGTGTGAGATITVTVPAGGVPAGSLIFVAATDLATTAGGSVVDTAGNTYTLISSVARNGAGANGFVRTYYAKNSTALASGNSITLTKVDGTARGAMTALYATGMNTSAPLDLAVTATGSSAAPSVASGAPAVAGELFIGVVNHDEWVGHPSGGCGQCCRWHSWRQSIQRWNR
jgi:hypothetical protein